MHKFEIVHQKLFNSLPGNTKKHFFLVERPEYVVEEKGIWLGGIEEFFNKTECPWETIILSIEIWYYPDVEKINYVIYDCVCPGSYISLMSKINIFMKHVFFIDTIEITTMKQIEDAHTHYTDYGYEGIMIRGDGPYKHGRSKDLLKYKKFKDDEFLVVGHTEGTGAHAGTAIFICKTNDKTFNVVMNGPLEKRREMLTHVNDYYGKNLTVKYLTFFKIFILTLSIKKIL